MVECLSGSPSRKRMQSQAETTSCALRPPRQLFPVEDRGGNVVGQPPCELVVAEARRRRRQAGLAQREVVRVARNQVRELEAHQLASGFLRASSETAVERRSSDL